MCPLLAEKNVFFVFLVCEQNLSSTRSPIQMLTMNTAFGKKVYEMDCKNREGLLLGGAIGVEG